MALGDAIGAGQPIARVRERAALATLAGESRAADEAATVEMLWALIESMVAAAGAGYIEQEIVSAHEGELVALHLAPGQPVIAGVPVAGIRAVGGALEAHAYVTPGQAAQLAAGMAARVQVADRTGVAISAEVLDVSPRPVAPPAWLGDGGPARVHLVRVTVPEGAGGDPAVTDGAAVRLRVIVGRGSFLSLLAPARG